MLRFAANLSMLFNELPFMERFAAAKKAGFKYVEFMFPYDYDLAEIKKELEENNLKLVLFNLPAGNWAEGERGIAVSSNRCEEFKKGVHEAIVAAQKLDVSQINCLVGKKPDDSAEIIQSTLVENLSYAADEFVKHNINLLIEPINHYDIPGFYLNTTQQALDLITKINRKNIKLQYDIYHAEREEENHNTILDNDFNMIGHIQIADNPGRHQPGTGVISWNLLFNKIENLGYTGYIGMEYKPDPETVASLYWVKDLGYSI